MSPLDPPAEAPAPGARPHGALHVDTLDALGSRLASGEVAPGEVLTLDAIRREHGVSLPVAREAVRVLESMGMVVSRRRVGVTVQDPSDWNVFDPRLVRWRLEGSGRTEQLLAISELRQGFEPVAARLAADRATPEQCRAMAEATTDMAVHGRTGDLEAYLLADVAFHRTLLDASGNDMVRALAGLVEEVLAGRTHHDLMPARPNPTAIALHDEVARCVRTGDGAGAEHAMRAIIDEAAGAMTEQAATDRARARE
ncbi:MULTISPECIES: FadR/GntR family transcriptional regulator [unclassified Nocardioides]|uniref:FadR/GntR family transcriptional regulator n=2 Tax=Nocardioides TaxID=1839 RepID=UPI001E5A35C4|nr:MULTISPECIES: FCD domain-containing protein [unclassified Nocardioides]MCM3514215.1 FCD domain-containing protein [Nocardioides sp. P86]